MYMYMCIVYSPISFMHKCTYELIKGIIIKPCRCIGVWR